jgi:hypothetical protein
MWPWFRPITPNLILPGDFCAGGAASWLSSMRSPRPARSGENASALIAGTTAAAAVISFRNARLSTRGTFIAGLCSLSAYAPPAFQRRSGETSP